MKRCLYTHTCAHTYTFVYVCVHTSIRMHVYNCTHTSSGSVCWSSDTWVAMSTSSIQTLASKDHSPQKRNKSSLQKWLIPGLRLKKYKMSLENFWPDRERAELGNHHSHPHNDKKAERTENQQLFWNPPDLKSQGKPLSQNWRWWKQETSLLEAKAQEQKPRNCYWQSHWCAQKWTLAYLVKWFSTRVPRLFNGKRTAFQHMMLEKFNILTQKTKVGSLTLQHVQN